MSGFQQEVVLCGRDGHLAVRNGDLYGKKGSRGKEELLYADPSISPTSVPPEAISSTILPPLYLQGTVLMFRELARRFQSTEDDSPDSSSLSCSTFEDAQYAQAVIESVRASSRDRRWTKVNVQADDEDGMAASPALSSGSGYFFSHKHNIPQLHLN